jgi:transposase-like protein
MKKCDDEFKQNAVEKILDGQSVASVARELGIGEGLFHKWKRRKIESGY